MGLDAGVTAARFSEAARRRARWLCVLAVPLNGIVVLMGMYPSLVSLVMPLAIPVIVLAISGTASPDWVLARPRVITLMWAISAISIIVLTLAFYAIVVGAFA